MSDDFDELFDEAPVERMGAEGIPIRGNVIDLDERHITGRATPRGLGDMAWDALAWAQGDRSAGERLTEDASGYLEADGHGTTGIDHLLQAATLGLADEGRGFVRAGRAALERGDLLDGLTGDRPSYERFQADYRRERDTARRELEEGAEARPGLSALGTAAGIGVAAPLTPSLGIGAGGGALARIGGAAVEGGIYGAAGGFGSSDADLTDGAELARDTVGGALMGAVAGGALRAGGEALSTARAAVPGVRTAADRARIAATAGPGPGLTDRAVRELAGANPSPERLREVADTLRRLDIAPAAGTTDDIARAAGEATDRLDADRLAMIDEILAASPDGEGRIPLSRVLRSLDEVGDDLGSRAVDRPYAPIARRVADDFAATYGEPPTPPAPWHRIGARDPDPMIPYRTLGEEISAMRNRTRWLDPEVGEVAPPEAIRRRLHGALRDVQDDYAAALLGPESADRLRRIRGDMRVSIGASEAADRHLSRSARYTLGGLSDMTAAGAGAASGATPAQLATLLGLRRAVAARGPSLRATGLETVARVLDAAPERLGPWADVLRRLISAGVGMETAHEHLFAADPDYRAAVEALDDTGEGAPDDFASMWAELPEETDE